MDGLLTVSCVDLASQLEVYSVLNAYTSGGLDSLDHSHLVSLNNNIHTLREHTAPWDISFFFNSYQFTVRYRTYTYFELF